MDIRRLLLIGAGLLASGVMAATSAVAPAAAAMRISDDRGGQIGHYLQTFSLVRASGEKVIIDGNCLSACTLLLGLMPRDRVCATGRARLGFHAAWLPGEDGRPITSMPGTQALWRIYPASVKQWINRRGGLSRTMIYLEGRELAKFVPSCGGVEKRQASNTGERVVRERNMRRAERAAEPEFTAALRYQPVERRARSVRYETDARR